MTAQEFRAKHATRTKAALEDMRRGINAVTTAPGQAAAASAEKMRNNLNASIDSGKWQRRVGAVSLEDWKKQMLDKGVQRVPGGIDAAATKVEAFASQLLPFQTTLEATVNRLPNVTLEDAINRMATFVRGMATFEFRR
jgi:hypothetical protein